MWYDIAIKFGEKFDIDMPYGGFEVKFIFETLECRGLDSTTETIVGLWGI